MAQEAQEAQDLEPREPPELAKPRKYIDILMERPLRTSMVNSIQPRD
jgi:hypothetical protein